MSIISFRTTFKLIVFGLVFDVCNINQTLNLSYWYLLLTEAKENNKKIYHNEELGHQGY